MPLDLTDRPKNRSTLGDLIHQGTDGWFKVGLCAIITPLFIGFITIRDGLFGMPDNPVMLVAGFLALALTGALIGVLLSMWGIVSGRLANKQPVALPYRMLFAHGVWSVVLVWIPAVILLTFVGTMLSIFL